MRPTGSAEIAQLARNLHRMGPAGRRALAARMRALGQPILSNARSRSGWSSRIPNALTVTSKVRDTTVGIELRARAAAAPHARPYEGLGQGGKFRHPVHGHRGRWVSQATRPFLAPAVQANEGRAAQACAAAYEDAARAAGFH